jgi:hypothetical protein
MSTLLLLTLLLSFLSPSSTLPLTQTCEYTDTESYLYDFTELHRSADYAVTDSSKTSLYKMNVCTPVEETACKRQNGLLCQYSLDSSNPSSLSLSKVLITSNTPVTWDEDDDSIYMKYNNVNDGITVTYQFTCNDAVNININNIQPTLKYESASEYIFEFQVPHACAEYLDEVLNPDGTITYNKQQGGIGQQSGNNRRVPANGANGHSGGKHPRRKGWHVSSILAFTIVMILFVYFVGGIVYNRHHSGGSSGGLIGSIPHYAFWSELPSLVSDGFYYSIDKCRNIYYTIRGQHEYTSTATSGGDYRNGGPSSSNAYEQI